MELKERVLKSNNIFWQNENKRNSSNGMLLYENLGDVPQMLYPISKIALCIAKALDLEPAVILPWRGSKMSESMCKKQFQIVYRLPLIFLTHILSYINVMCFLNKSRLLGYTKNGDTIGKYMYDAILRKYCKQTLKSLTMRERFFICYLLSFYFYYRYLIKKYPVKAVVLEDEVYLLGLMYELCKNNGIVCYSPISLNTYFLKKHIKKEDFRSNYLSFEILDKLCTNKDYKAEVASYFSNRYSGHLEQHDVLSAYANKKVSSSLQFSNKYKIDPSKKTVIIMSHVFADAPHVYTDALYDDYWEWFVTTYNILSQNTKINLLVKEHPSAYLYGEKGVIRNYLAPKGMSHILIDEDESTLSILQNVDVVVTCGGTIGIEMAYIGKNVVLASKPPYSGLGITKDFGDRKTYEEYLRNEIQNIQPLNNSKKEIAIKAAYVMFCRTDNWSSIYELGCEKIYLGRKYDDSLLYEKIIRYNEVELEKQNIYKLIYKFVNSESKQLYNSH